MEIEQLGDRFDFNPKTKWILSIFELAQKIAVKQNGPEFGNLTFGDAPDSHFLETHLSVKKAMTVIGSQEQFEKDYDLWTSTKDLLGHIDFPEWRKKVNKGYKERITLLFEEPIPQA